MGQGNEAIDVVTPDHCEFFDCHDVARNGLFRCFELTSVSMSLIAMPW
ncbi:MAG: hypothetical protein OXD40_14350 [bacterium]|nr:hypothetical protein [bacterium]